MTNRRTRAALPEPEANHRAWRIVDTDNFGGDYPNERFLLWEMKKDMAQKIADLLNEDAGPNAHRFYKVVARDYELAPGFEP